MAVLLLVAWGSATILAQAAPPGQAALDPMCAAPMRSDARLHDVCFVSPEAGWAVGDRGTIWHTDDGGENWRLQDSGVGCPLHSVWFLDQRVGWAAGGWSQPYHRGSRGVLLSTTDGGQSWKPTSKSILPKIRKIRFFDRQTGFGLGDASAVFPSGVFVTQSGGRDWRAIHGDCAGGWRGGDLIDPDTGAVAGDEGAAAVVRRGAIDTDRSPDFGLRTLRGVQLVRPTWGWLIGDGAMVMLTGDLGSTWRPAPGELPEGAAANFDFAALAVRGPKCWVAGSPGTRVFRTEDAGKSWAAFATGSNVPIHAITMMDDRRGWAVGSLGTILATPDGGQPWRRQRAGGARAAILGLFSRSADVPLELFAQLSGNDGYLGVIEVLNRDDPRDPPRGGAPLEDRLREAVARLGASDAAVAWQFPSRPDAFELGDRAVVEDWDRVNDGRGLAALEAHLVRQIRLWRPEIVVTHGTGFTGADSRRRLISQTVLAAVERAADPASYVDQLTAAGLAPWQVKKVYGVEGAGGDAATHISEARIAERLARSLGEVAADARGLLEGRCVPEPETLGFRLLFDQTGQEGGQGGFFSRIDLAPGSEARRHLLDPPAAGILSLEQLARKRRTVGAILRRSGKNSLGGWQVLAHADELTEGMDAGTAARLLYQLADGYRRRGQWSLAAETLEAMADRYPEHPLGGEALVWLVQYYASAEAAWRVEDAERKMILADGRTPTPSVDRTVQEDRLAKAAALAQRLGRTWPELFAEPTVGFPLLVVDRMRGSSAQAAPLLIRQRRRARHDAWWSCAAGESWLAQPVGQSPKPIVRCARAAAKPKLDGQLDEACWQETQGAVLGDARQGELRPATLKLAYDELFLYVACQCPQEPAIDYSATPGPRPRDADLSSHDRVELFLDIDRDYVSYYRLDADHRGWTREECWGDPSWNPTWFVAAAADHGTWTIEAAIPFDQLTGRRPRTGDAWALGAQRLAPGVGLQSWNWPASPEIIPEGFGYLVFE